MCSHGHRICARPWVSSCFIFGDLSRTCLAPSEAGRWLGGALRKLCCEVLEPMCRGHSSGRRPPVPRSARAPGSFGTFRALPHTCKKGQQHARGSGLLGIPHTWCDCQREPNLGCWCRGRCFSWRRPFCYLLSAWPGCEAWSCSPVCRRRGPGEGGMDLEKEMLPRSSPTRC